MRDGPDADGIADDLHRMGLSESLARLGESLAERRIDTEIPASASTEWSGRFFGDYYPVELIGRGGQATVYLARDTRLGRSVALKVLSGPRLGSEDGRRRFEREAKAASKLHHPAICTVYEVGDEGGTPFIAMRFVAGEGLDRKIKAAQRRAEIDPTVHHVAIDVSSHEIEHALETDPDWTGRAGAMRILEIAESVARALHAAHGAGVVHRDMKPGNVMITPEGDPVILDFGLARDEDESSPTLTLTGEIMGTPAYMAPEQIQHDLRAVDARSDVFTLGATLFECLTLTRPFEAPTREGLFRAILTESPPNPRHLNPAISRDLAVVLETALAKDRDRRYRTARDFADDLAAVRARRAIRARPASAASKVKRWAERNPLLASLTVLFAISLAAGALLVFSYTERLEGQALELQHRAEEMRSLHDLGRVRQLEQQAETLLPDPEREDELVAWLEKAREVLTRQEIHERHFDELSSRGRVVPRVDSRSGPRELERIEHLRKVIVHLQDEIDRAEGPRRDRLERALDQWQDELDQLLPVAESFGEDRRFADPADQERFDAIAHVVISLRRFRSTVRDVATRLDAARRVGPETVARHATEWRAAIAAVDADPAYSDLDLRPQIGLIPLGIDPTTGLAEFLHWGSHDGPLPTRDDAGRLQIGAECGLVFVLLPGGVVRQEAPPLALPAPWELIEPERSAGEPIAVEPFFFSKYEMTQAQWLRITGGPNPSDLGLRATESRVNPLKPVTHVTWYDCRRVLGSTGLELPTEEQWEYGARAGTSTLWWSGNEGLELSTTAEGRDPSAVSRPEGGHLILVGDGAERFGAASVRLDDRKENLSFRSIGDTAADLAVRDATAGVANAFGLLNVHGNVSEWCASDWSPDTDPVGADALGRHAFRVIRGGDYRSSPLEAYSSRRHSRAPAYRGAELGVRPARTLR